MKGKKRIIGFAASVVILVAVAGTLGYYTQMQSINNPMTTGFYGDTFIEEFTPDTNWEPGEEVTKEIEVMNTGDYDIVVRISMSETWTFQDDSSLTIAGNTDEFYPASASVSGQINATDGLVMYDDVTDGSDGSVVYKKLDTSLLSSGEWYYCEGYWYYLSVLEPGETTTSFLKSITLCEDTDMGVYAQSEIYYAVTKSDITPDESDEAWSTTYPVDELLEDEFLHVRTVSTTSYAGYSDAVYTLTVTSQTCQASADAIVDAFGENAATEALMEDIEE